MPVLVHPHNEHCEKGRLKSNNSFTKKLPAGKMPRKIVSVLFIATVASVSLVNSHKLARHDDTWDSTTLGARSKRQATFCRAQCSLQFMLHCNFPSLDPCLERGCRRRCRRDGHVMNSCHCRSVMENDETKPRHQRKVVTFRACFCQPKPKNVP